MVWINDKRIKDAQLGLIRAGFPTTIKIVGRREFLMIISLKKLKKAVEGHVTTPASYKIFDASEGSKLRLGIVVVGDFSTLKIEEYGELLRKLEREGFKTNVELSEDFRTLKVIIDLDPLITVFTARGIPRRLFTEKIKVTKDMPFLIIHFKG